MRLLLALVLLFATLLPAGPLRAEPADIRAASRSVVRVVLVARDGEQVFYVGHGSGVAVAPGLVLTNAHVVEPAVDDASIILGVVPSSGQRSYGASIVARSPGRDLALLRFRAGGIPPATILTREVADGDQVVAIGYPGSVDRAQGLDISDLISPISPVRSPGVVSGGRSARAFDTVLHTAALAQGNSGGPLVDACGRVVGINSFGSLSDGNDAEFGFAVSAREILAFLTEAGVQFARTAEPCRSLADIRSEEAERNRAEESRRAREAEALDRARGDAARKAERDALYAVLAERERALLLAAGLLGLALLALGHWVPPRLSLRARRGPLLPVAALLLLGGAALVIALRPGFDAVTDRAAAALRAAQRTPPTPSAPLAGSLSCTLDRNSSRVTVSDRQALDLEWTANGCVNGRTQYAQDGGRWSRIFVPNEDSAVAINSFEPATGTFRTERFLLDLDAIAEARRIRSGFKGGSCGAPAEDREALGTMQRSLRAALPGEPNETLVYRCQRAPG